MNVNEKTVLARFLDTAGDYLHSGYAKPREGYDFSDAPAPLPLAYLVDELDENDDSLEDICAAVNNCSACALGKSRTNAVPGEGVSQPLVMVIGEAPGADEDAQGRPFVGKAGQLLDKMLASVGLDRGKNCFIANTIKCRPPGNRNPESGEMDECAAYLDRQIRLLRPLLILCLGKVSIRRILQSEEPIARLRGRFSEYMGIPVLPSYHPSALLRNEAYKRPAWEDLKLLREKLISLDSAYAEEQEKAQLG